MGKRGGEKGGERVVSGYIHPRRRVSFNREREKLFPRDEEGKKEGEGGEYISSRSRLQRSIPLKKAAARETMADANNLELDRRKCK